MKIAHVVDSMEVGGAEMLVSQICRLQREQGHEPCVYAIGALGSIGEQMRHDGFSIHENVGRHLSEAPWNFYRLFKRSRPDVVHLHNRAPTINAAIPARMAGVPSIVSTRHNLAGPPRRIITELEYAIAARCCDWIAGVCDATTRNLKQLHSAPARKIVRIYNGVLPIDRATRDRWPRREGFTLLYAGRLAPVKNLGFLLNAFRASLTSMPGPRLWMVGDGSERRVLENLAMQLGVSAQVTFWGQQLNVTPFFSAADAFIMSSSSEGLPVSLLQAFSVGLPAIVTDVGGMAEAVRLANGGLIVSVTDPADMSDAILRLAGNDDEREQFARSAEAAFRARFTLETMADAYMDLYLDTTRSRRSRQAYGFAPCDRNSL
jgi:L-malate glycosyltransferase